MPKSSKTDELQQVATRVSPEAHQVLQIARAAEGKSMQDLLRPVVEGYAEQLAQEPEIREMLAQARKYAARKQGVELLPEKSPAKRRRPLRRSSAGN